MEVPAVSKSYPAPKRALSTKIALPTLEGFRFEPIRDIVHLSAHSNYTEIHFLNGRKVLVCRTLREMEQHLRPRRAFVRVHRSHTIHLEHLARYIRANGGSVVMDNGAHLSVSAGRRNAFLASVEQYFG